MAFRLRRDIYDPPSQAEWVRIATNPQLAGAVRSRTNQAKTIAISESASFTDTGQYASSFEVEVFVKVIRGRGFRGNRVVGRLSNRAPYAANVERKHKVLSRTKDRVTQR